MLKQLSKSESTCGDRDKVNISGQRPFIRHHGPSRMPPVVYSTKSDITEAKEIYAQLTEVMQIYSIRF